MNFKKFISGVSALTIAASAFAGMAVTANAATGDVTTLANIDFSNAISNNSVAGTVGSMTTGGSVFISDDNTESHGSGNGKVATQNVKVGSGELMLKNGSGTVAFDTTKIGTRDTVKLSFDLDFGKLNNKYTQIYAMDSSNNKIFDVQFDVYNGDFNGVNTLGLNWDNMYRGSNGVINRGTHFDITLNYTAKTITTYTSCKKNGSTETNKTYDAVAMPSDAGTIASFVVYSDYDNDGRLCTFDNFVAEVTEGDYTTATADYTVDYMVGTTKVDTRVVSGGTVGQAPAPNMSTFYANNNKYVCDSSNASELKIASDGSTVVTVNCSAYAKVSTATVNYKVDDDIVASEQVAVSGYVDESVRVPYHAYRLVGGKLYSAGTTDDDAYYGKQTTLTADTTVDVAVTEVTGDYVAYIDFDDTTADNAYSRASGMAASRPASATIGNVTAGTYTLDVRGYARNQQTYVYLDGVKLAQVSVPDGSWKNGTTTITVPTAGSLTLVAEDGKTDYIDYIVLKKLTSATATLTGVTDVYSFTKGQEDKVTAAVLNVTLANESAAINVTYKENKKTLKSEVKAIGSVAFGVIVPDVVELTTNSFTVAAE